MSNENDNDNDNENENENENGNSTLTPLWEVFIRPRGGLNHKHVGSLHAADEKLAMQAARDVYTRREEGNSIWIIRSADIIASDPNQADENFDPATDKAYRHPSFYKLPDGMGHK